MTRDASAARKPLGNDVPSVIGTSPKIVARQALAEHPLDSVDELDDFDVAFEHDEERALLAFVHRVFAGGETDVGARPREPLAVGRRERREQRDVCDLFARDHGRPESMRVRMPYGRCVAAVAAEELRQVRRRRRVVGQPVPVDRELEAAALGEVMLAVGIEVQAARGSRASAAPTRRRRAARAGRRARRSAPHTSIRCPRVPEPRTSAPPSRGRAFQPRRLGARVRAVRGGSRAARAAAPGSAASPTLGAAVHARDLAAVDREVERAPDADVVERRRVRVERDEVERSNDAVARAPARGARAGVARSAAGGIDAEEPVGLPRSTAPRRGVEGRRRRATR